MEEIWKPIKDFENIYEISNTGRVRRVSGNVANSTHSTRHIEIHDKKLSVNVLRHGYLQCHLFKSNKDHLRNVHRLVAQAFIPNPLNFPQVNHKDENPSNNSVENLEWCTGLYNMRYGTAIKRQVAKRSKAVIQMDLSGNVIDEFSSTNEAATKLGLPQGLIVNCCNGGYWRDGHTKYIKCNRVHNFKFKYK